MAACHRLIVPFLLVASMISAQEAPRFEEKVDVRLIDLEVFVTDASGNRVSGLTAEDFTLLEDGKPQEITNFSEIDREELDGTAALSGVRKHVLVEPRPPRTIVLFIDYIPITPPERKELFGRLREFADEALEPGDRATVIHWKFPAEVLVELTSDETRVLAALEELANTSVPPEARYGLDAEEAFHQEAQDFLEDVLNRSPGLPRQGPVERIEIQDSDPRSAATQSDVSLRNCARRFQAEMEWKTTAMKNVITSISGVEGRKIFVYVASRFPANAATYCLASRRAGGLQAELGQFDTGGMIESVTDTANAAGVSFYALRPLLKRSPGSAENRLIVEGGTSEIANEQLELLNDSRAMGELAEQTGGLFATGGAIFDTLPRVIDDLDSYYSIAYRSRSDSADRERRIELSVPDRDLKVRVRRSLIDKSPKSQVKDWLVANLFADSRAGELQTELVPGEVREEKGRKILPLELKIPLDQLVFAGDPEKAKFTVLSAAGKSLGVVTPVREDTRELERPDAEPGVAPFVTYELEMMMDGRDQRISIALFDPASGLASFHVVDQDGKLLLDRESLQPSWLEWRALIDEMRQKDRPMLVYLRPSDCNAENGSSPCEQFETGTLRHTEIEKRLGSVAFSSWTLERGVPPSVWPSTRPGLVLVRDDGSPIARWQELPEPMVLAGMLDRIRSASSQIERSGSLVESGKVEDADLEAGWIAMHLGRPNEARRKFEELAAAGQDPEVKAVAAVRLAFLDVIEGVDGAEQRLESLGRSAQTATARSEAWIAVAAVRGNRFDRSGRIQALRSAMDVAPKNSPQWLLARGFLESLDALETDGRLVRLIPMAEEVLSGRIRFQADVTSSDVELVEFFLDGAPVASVGSPSFATTIDLGDLPEPHSIRITALDSSGNVVGEDAVRLNDYRNLFRVQIVSPQDGVARGETAVEVAVLVPSGRTVRRVEVLTGATEVASFTSGPYRASVQIPARPTILSARAYLDDGSFSEDIVLLNAEGYAAEAAVHLVELPVTTSSAVSLAPSDLEVRERGKVRSVETIVQSGESPLTVGLLIDNSASMWERALDVQAAASEFLDRVLDEGDRAFIVSFDSLARLVQKPTTDRDLLKAKLRGFEPQGLTVMNDAVMLGLLQFQATPGRRALVVFSDGVDKGSRHELDQVREMARRAGVPIYLVRAETEELTSIPNDERFARQRYERELASVIRSSGGDAYVLSGLQGLLDAYRQIADDIRRQILVTYLTEGKAGSLEWRDVEVRSRRPGVNVRAPSGFYVGSR